MATGYQLADDGTYAADSPLVFGGFPGVWRVGVPQSAGAFGWTDDELEAAAEEAGVRLERVTGLDPADLDTAASTADVISPPLPSFDPADPAAPSGVPGLTNAELADREEWDADRRARTLPVGGGEIPQTFTTEETEPAGVHTTPTDDALLVQRAAWESLTLEQIKTYVPDGLDIGRSKASAIDALLDAGILAPGTTGSEVATETTIRSDEGGE